MQHGEDVVLVDAGVMFPEEELYGVDLVIPDFGFLRRGGRRLLGVLLTHGHEDHVGGFSFLLREFRVPVYGTPLTLGLVRNKVRDGALHPVQPRQRVRLGPFEAEWVRVAHSVPDSCSVVVRTPAGTVVVSGDFKFDQTPIDGRPTDVARLAELGEEGVLALLLDSTKVERPGMTPSERVVGERFHQLFKKAPGRVLVTTFASNVQRLQQAFDAAAASGRKVAAVGRSMVDVIRAASELGYLKFGRDAYVSAEEANRFPDRKVLLLVTGSKGEPLSALSRIATRSHRQVRLERGDTVVFCASPIPGNEATVARTINQLFRQGAEMVYGPTSGAHVSGHASREELRLMIHLLRPGTWCRYTASTGTSSSTPSWPRGWGCLRTVSCWARTGRCSSSRPGTARWPAGRRWATCWSTASAWATWGRWCCGTGSTWRGTGSSSPWWP
ncbi:MAG: ribonuclease J [Armatimonadota bacterium]|nr:ribonuclease J [Armatimonadota bacterium]